MTQDREDPRRLSGDTATDWSADTGKTVLAQAMPTLSAADRGNRPTPLSPSTLSVADLVRDAVAKAGRYA